MREHAIASLDLISLPSGRTVASWTERLEEGDNRIRTTPLETEAASGLYVLRVRAHGATAVRKLVMLR
jgi:hypothetical protein